MTAPATAPREPRRDERRSTRHAARVAAVQALYQVAFSRAEPRNVVIEFLAHRMSESDTEAAPDQAFFSEVVEGACERLPQLDARIGETLPAGWPLERLDPVLAALLRCAAFEITARPDVPPRVAINEYVEIAHDFFSGKEPGMVNAVLDRLARAARPEAFATDADTASSS